MIAMLELLLNGHPSYAGRVDRELLFVSDVRLNERIGVAPDHTARLADIEAACRQIASQWERIRPHPSIWKKPDDEG